MKKKIAKKFFRKELEEFYSNLEYYFEQKKIKMDMEMKHNRNKYNIAKHIFKTLPNAHIIGIDTNKNNDELFVCFNLNCHDLPFLI